MDFYAIKNCILICESGGFYSLRVTFYQKLI